MIKDPKDLKDQKDPIDHPYTFPRLDELEDFEPLFDAPINSPAPVEAPYSGPSKSLEGELAAFMEGESVTALVRRITNLSEVASRDLVDFGSMWINNSQVLDPNFLLPKSGTFKLCFPEYGPQRFYEANISRIILEDDCLMVYRKESGRPSQAVPHDAYNNVHSALMRLRGIFLRLPHRLDIGTSGLLILAKTQKAAGFLGRAFQKGNVNKRYLALSEGIAPQWKERELIASIAKEDKRYVVREEGPGLVGRTHFKVLGVRGDKVLFLATPHTGRTHQIRLHLSHLGYPIIGDAFYGGRPSGRLMLEASGIDFPHPQTFERVILGGPF
jgi:23S rRNA pseudouridine1911/1915/1917 synthase